MDPNQLALLVNLLAQGPMAPGGAPMPTGQQFNTKLSPEQEAQFQAWKQLFAPKDSGMDYDLRGAFQAGVRPDPVTGHWPDAHKKPNHPTFSDQSVFSSLVGTNPGQWQGETYVPMPRRQK